MAETILLGGARFELRPLKLGQLRHLLDALADMAGKSGGALIDAAAQVVALGLAAANPELTAGAVLDLEAGVDELNGAVAAILRAAGLRPVGEAPSPGGRPAMAAPGTTSENPAAATSSAPSMAPSPPAAAIPIATSTA